MDFRAWSAPFPQKNHKTFTSASLTWNIVQKNRGPSPILTKISQHNLYQALKLACRKKISIQVF